MTASEIREFVTARGADTTQNVLLAEIAGQLSRANERRRPIWIEFMRRGRKCAIDVSRVVDIYRSETGEIYIHQLGELPEADAWVDGTWSYVSTRIRTAQADAGI